MATDRFPQRNATMPMSEERIRAARAKLDPGHASPANYPASDGKGSRREIRKGEWLDDRVITPNARPTPSPHNPPPLPDKRELPASYDPAMVYNVKFGSPCQYVGRVMNPGRSYKMTGNVCADPNVQPKIIDAVLIGPTPAPPDVGPTTAKNVAPTTAKKKA